MCDKSHNAFDNVDGKEVSTSQRINNASNNQLRGGASRDRTDDLKLAKLALSQLSYGPDPRTTPRFSKRGGPGKI